MAETEAKASGGTREGAEDEPREEQNEINEIRAEEESAAAMDSDVPQPSDDSQEGEGEQT